MLVSPDDRPAQEVCCEQVEAPEDGRCDPVKVFAFAPTCPVGIARRNRTEIRQGCLDGCPADLQTSREPCERSWNSRLRVDLLEA